MTGDRTTYTVVNHVIEFSVRGGPWGTWAGVNPDLVAGMDATDAQEEFSRVLKTRHDPANGVRFRLVHRVAVIDDFVAAEELPDGRVAVPKDHGEGPEPAQAPREVSGP